jgi:hypothetical protein
MLEHDPKPDNGCTGNTDDRMEQHDHDWEEAGEEDVPTVVLYVVAGLLLISFSLYLIVGGGHNHFH